MRTRVRVGVAAIGSAALVMCGVGISAATRGDTGASSGKALQSTGLGPNTTVPTPDESTFVPIASCRIADTRTKGGPVRKSRSFYVDGTAHFGTQGGNSGGCGIPAGATAIAANIMASGSTKAGVVRAHAAGTAAPQGWAVNFAAKHANANGLTLAVRPGTAQGLTVSATVSVQIVIDVTGYFEPQISGYVTSSGGLDTATSRVVSVTHTIGSGSYQVTIDRDVESCTAALTIGGTGAYAGGYDASGNVLSVFTWRINSTGVAVSTDAEFNFSIVC